MKLDELLKIKTSQLVFAGILVLLASIAWTLIYFAFYQVYTGLGAWLAVIFFVFALSVAVGLSFFLFLNRTIALVTYVIMSLPALVLFGWRGYEFVGVVIFFATVIFGYIWVNKERRLLIKFLYTRLIRRGMPIFFTGLAITLALFYRASPMGDVFERPQIPRTFFDVVLTPVEYLTQQALPEFDIDMKVSEVGELGAREAPRFIDAPPEIVGGVVQNIFSRIPQVYQDKSIVGFLHETANAQLDAILAPYREFLPFIFFIGLFLVFRAIAVPLMWLSMVVGWTTMKILLLLGILKLEKVETEKEELVI